MGDRGLRYPKTKIGEAIRYTDLMAKDGRVLSISDELGIHSVFYFSICEDHEPFLKKLTWEYLPHNPSGHIVYLEKAVSRGYSKEMRKNVETFITTKYPNVTLGKWHRWGKTGDRGVLTRRYGNVQDKCLV